MRMTPEQAKFLLNEVLLPQVQNEAKTTKRVFESMPADQGGYKPDPKSMGAWELATHIAGADNMFLDGIPKGAFDHTGTTVPDSVKTPAELAAWYEAAIAKGTAGLASLKPEDLVRVIDFFGVFKMPAVSYLQVLCSHSIHHRGQLSAYLRPMGGKVPAIYGGSADEPFQMPASA
jgi:uncharacterized damage-inducible protein DinB